MHASYTRSEYFILPETNLLSVVIKII
jgi:hypothetical protein